MGLSNFINIPQKEIDDAILVAESSYRSVVIKNGRAIDIPADFLKNIQSKIAHMLHQVYVHPCVHSYCKNLSVLSALKPHYGKNTVVKTDIRNFFGSVTKKMLEKYLIYIVVKDEESSMSNPKTLDQKSINQLISLCTYKGVLPIGAPSSPMLSNIVMKRFDNRVCNFLNRRNINYTRYADDIVISGHKAQKYIKYLYQSMKKNGFEPNVKKTKVMHAKHQQKVFGIVLNRVNYNLSLKNKTSIFEKQSLVSSSIRTSRQYRRQTRAMKHQLKLQHAKAKKGDGLLDYKEQNKKVIDGREAWQRHVKDSNSRLIKRKITT